MYFITTIEELEDGCHPKGTRTVGYRSDLSVAIETVENNVCDIWEYLYEYAVIEELGEGLYPEVKKRILFKFNHDKNKYEQISLDFPYVGWQAANIG